MEYKVGDKVRIKTLICGNGGLCTAEEIDATIEKIINGDHYLFKVGSELLMGRNTSILGKIPEFTKEDLKSGMVVEYRDGMFAVILPFQNGLSTITEDGTALNLSRFTDDLRYPSNCDIDIIRVYGLSENARAMLNFSKEHRELLWERKERRRMTIGEIKRIAEEKIGEQIEIVEKLRNDRITIGGAVFTDIKEAQAVLNKVSEWEDIYKRLAGRK